MASKRRIRRNSCTGKVQYDDAKAGNTAVFHLKQRTRDTSWYNVYRCKFCKKFHIGHSPGSSRIM